MGVTLLRGSPLAEGLSPERPVGPKPSGVRRSLRRSGRSVRFAVPLEPLLIPLCSGGFAYRAASGRLGYWSADRRSAFGGPVCDSTNRTVYRIGRSVIAGIVHIQ